MHIVGLAILETFKCNLRAWKGVIVLADRLTLPVPSIACQYGCEWVTLFYSVSYLSMLWKFRGTYALQVYILKISDVLDRSFKGRGSGLLPGTSRFPCPLSILPPESAHWGWKLTSTQPSFQLVAEPLVFGGSSDQVPEILVQQCYWIKLFTLQYTEIPQT